MLDQAPKEPEGVSWSLVGLLSLLIFATAPLARNIEAVVVSWWGNGAFVYAGAAALLIATVAAVGKLRRRARGIGPYLAAIVVVSGFVAAAYTMTSNTIEVIHFVEYGLLGLLAYRALVHRVRDFSIYIAAALVVAIVGMIDETIQWVAPGRYWDLQDISINATAGVLTQVGIATALRPTVIRNSLCADSLRRLCHLSAIALLLLAFAFWNTPARINWYASRIAPLSFLLSGETAMVEYGYRFADSDTGVFRSRFTADQLDALAQARGTELAQILDDLGEDNYGEFLKTYTVLTDPYVHEAGVHLFRRNRRLSQVLREEAAKEYEHKRAEHYDIPHRENQILEKYFPGALDNAQRWAPELRSRVAAKAASAPRYESAVSRKLVTRVTDGQILGGVGLVLIGCLGLSFALGRARR